MKESNLIQKVVESIYEEPEEEIGYLNDSHGYIEREDVINREELRKIGCEVHKVVEYTDKECDIVNRYTEYVLIPYSKLECNKYGAVIMCSHHADNIKSEDILENIVDSIISSEDKKLSKLYDKKIETKNLENAIIYSCGNVEFKEGKNDFEVQKICPKCTEAGISKIKY